MTTLCGVCGEPMPPGEQMFKYHGFSGPCPKPPLPKPDKDVLPCDVHLPPNTYIRKGVPLSTLLTALEQRSGRGDEETKFP